MFNCPAVFPAHNDLPLPPLRLLDQIQDQHRRPISLQEIREVILCISIIRTTQQGTGLDDFEIEAECNSHQRLCDGVCKALNNMETSMKTTIRYQGTSGSAWHSVSCVNTANSSHELSAPFVVVHLSGRIHRIDPAVDDERLGDRYAALLCPEGRDGPPHLQKRRKNAFLDPLCVRDLQI